MKKGMKKAVATGLAFTAFSAVMPTILPESELFTQAAYAADAVNKTDANTSTISDLRLETSSGSKITIYDDDDYKSKDKVDTKDLKEDTQYYAKSKTKSIKLDDVSGVDDKYVRIFDSTSSSTKGVKVGKKISLSSGTNRITIRVYKEEPDDDVKYKEDSNKLADYTIKIKYTGSDHDDDDDDDDDDKIYLKKLEVSNRNEDDIKLSPEFDKKTNNYNVEVNKDTSYVVVTAKPEDDDDDDVKTKINGTSVDDDDDWEKKVYLNEGKNEIEVRVKNDDDDLLRVYTLYVYRGTKAPASTSEDNKDNDNKENSQAVVVGQPNQWIGSGSSWKRTNEKGEFITNSWFYDNYYRQNYYFDKDGYMAIGWKQIDGKWYCFTSGGVKQTGWVQSGSNWYYMDSNGVMQTGWLNYNGNFYYLNPNKANEGAMMTGTVKIMNSWYTFDYNGRLV